MAKTRLNNSKKDIVRGFMNKHFIDGLDDAKRQKLIDKLIDAINKILRKKYPEQDMVIIRKYNLAHQDDCLKFQDEESGAVFSLQFGYFCTEEQKKTLADIPYRRGCGSGEVFPCGTKLRAQFDELEKVTKARKDIIKNKRQEYWSFVEACRYVEEIEVVIPLPADLRTTLGQQAQSLVVISPEVINSIKADFSA